MKLNALIGYLADITVYVIPCRVSQFSFSLGLEEFTSVSIKTELDEWSIQYKLY